jgi:hypothetical protein
MTSMVCNANRVLLAWHALSVGCPMCRSWIQQDMMRTGKMLKRAHCCNPQVLLDLTDKELNILDGELCWPCYLCWIQPSMMLLTSRLGLTLSAATS